MANPDIAYRCHEEVLRICPNMGYAEWRYGITRQKMYAFRQGIAPNAGTLATLCRMGCDVVYILTGRKTNG